MLQRSHASYLWVFQWPYSGWAMHWFVCVWLQIGKPRVKSRQDKSEIVKGRDVLCIRQSKSIQPEELHLISVVDRFFFSYSSTHTNTVHVNCSLINHPQWHTTVSVLWLPCHLLFYVSLDTKKKQISFQSILISWLDKSYELSVEY